MIRFVEYSGYKRGPMFSETPISIASWVARKMAWAVLLEPKIQDSFHMQETSPQNSWQKFRVQGFGLGAQKH